MSKLKVLLTYRSLHGYKYELLKETSYVVRIFVNIGIVYAGINEGVLWIAEHYAWDGPSGPTIDTKTFMRGSLFHDVLYQMIREGVLDKKYRIVADKLLRKICLEDGMNKFRAWYVYRIIRIAGAFTSKPRKNPRGKIFKLSYINGKIVIRICKS